VEYIINNHNGKNDNTIKKESITVFMKQQKIEYNIYQIVIL